MKKILIVAYYFPPCNFIAAQRAGSFAENFSSHGLHPVIVTRHWRGDEFAAGGTDVENREPAAVTRQGSFTLIRLPYRQRLDRRPYSVFLKSRTGKNLLYAALYASGRVNPRYDADSCFRDFLVDYLDRNPVDYILATGFPMNAFRLGDRLSRRFGIPWIADFRDLWDNRLLADRVRPDAASRLQNRLYEHHLRRWLRSARLVTSVSPPLLEPIRRLAPRVPGLVVPNGFEEDVFARARSSHRPPGDRFVCSVVGTLKAQQDLGPLLDGLRLFLAGKEAGRIRLNFIGAGVVPEVRARLERSLPPSVTRVTDRIPRPAAIGEMLRSHVLGQVGWPGYRGIASGKIYEYLGARRNILVAPGDGDIMDRLVAEAEAGRTAGTAAETAAVLEAWYAEWKATGGLAFHGREERIAAFTRERQAGLLAREILRLE